MPDGPSSPRRTPRCRFCQQPRKGHPRSGCPTSSTRVDSEDVPTETGPLGEDASQALAQAHVHQPAQPHQANVAVDADQQRRRRRASAQPVAPQPTVRTIPNESAEIRAVAGPSHHAEEPVFEDEKTALRRRIERWRHAVPPDASASAPNTPLARHAELPGSAGTIAAGSSASLSAPLTRQVARALPRTMSQEERYNFLERLKQSTKRTAQVFIMEKSEVRTALDGAAKQGFHGGACIPAQGRDAFLVLGMDREAVSTLLETVKSEHGSPVRHGVAGAVVGAVAMWAGLAYS